MKTILYWLTILSMILESNALAQTNTSVSSVLTLANAQKLALQHHPQIAAANYRALAAQEVVTETRAGFFPNANAYANAVGAENEDARILAGGLNNPSIYDRLAGGLAVSQLITDFGRTANQIGRAHV